MKKVKFIGGNIYSGFDHMYGGTPMTIHCFLKSFENDPDYEIEALDRHSFLCDHTRIERFRKDADIFHVDDTSIINMMYEHEMESPDVIGPIARSPLKEYKGGKPDYPGSYFYQAKIIRLNYSEERRHKHLVNLIQHGVDTDYLQPNYDIKKKYVLWAGCANRYAKNYDMFKKIMEITDLPEPYEFKVMTDYQVQNYWNVLDETAILVNTSRYESFCCALFEGKSKGVATIHKVDLHGKGVHSDSEIQVEYTSEAYKEVILGLLNDDCIQSFGRLNRAYVLKHDSLNNMRDSIKEIYNQIT